MGLFHHVLVGMGNLHLVHPELNLSILIMSFVTCKFDDVLLEHCGLPHVLPLAVHLFFCAEQVEGVILSHIYSLGFIIKHLHHAHLQISVAHARTASEFKYATPFQPIRLLNLSSNPIRDGGVPYLKYLVGDNALNLKMCMLKS